MLDLTSSPLEESYTYLEGMERRNGKDMMRSRFIKVVYHRLRDRLCANQLRTNNVETAAQIIFRSGTADRDIGVVKQRFSRWTHEGRKVDALCRDIDRAESLDNLHLGNLLCLPEDVNDEL